MNYLKKLFLAFIVIYGSFISITFVVDPYDKIGLNLLNLKIKGVFDHRTNKFRHLDSTKEQYQAFILGSSRAMQLQPSIVEKYTGYKTFNYSVYTATPEDYLAMTKHIIEKQNPKLIILHIDFYAFNKSMYPSNQFYESPLYKYLHTVNKQTKSVLFFPKVYLSFDALRDSIIILDKNIHNKSEKHSIENGASTPQYQTKNDYRLLNEYWDKEYKNFKLSQERIEYLKQIKKLCEEHHIKLLVSLSPVSNKHYEKVEANENLKMNQMKVKETMCEVFGQYTDFFTNQTKEWSDTRFWMDSVHPTTLLGKLLTNEIISNKKKSFGKVVICH